MTGEKECDSCDFIFSRASDAVSSVGRQKIELVYVQEW